MIQNSWQCKECGKEELAAKTPDCCGSPMALKNAEHAPHPMTAESDRLADDDDVFDDGVH
jgi:hypothetical protein